MSTRKLPRSSLAWLVLVLSFALTACGSRAPAGATAPATPSDDATRQTDELNQFFTEVYMRTVKRNPMLQGYLGLDMDNDKWNDISDERAKEDHELAIADLERLRSEFSLDALTPQGRLSYELFERRLKESIDGFQWRFHSYPVNQMFGMHSRIPAFLGNYHRVDDVDDAKAYIARLDKLPALFAQLVSNLETREKRGIVPPAFVFPMVLEDCRNIITGAPFDDSGKDSAILADFRRKLDALSKVDDDTKAALLEDAIRSLTTAVKPAYDSLIQFMEQQAKRATADDGAWKLPDGAAFYARALKLTTTTDMTAEEIHALGLREVERIHGEMRQIMSKVGFEGTLQDFFAFLKTDQRFYFPNTEEGRQAYLTQAAELVAAMEAKLDDLFITKPKARMVVKRVEAYRENSAGLAFYNQPSLDGRRNGIYYVNLYDMKALPKYEMEALAFHEGIPGHHMQNAIAMEQTELPMFRRLLGYTAYGEGWGLYSERLGKELGFYTDPYSDFGRLSMELWRACRLVVDTGIHHERWTRTQAIEWLGTNTPGSDRDVRKAVERYIVMPSQATAYMIGMLEILRLRAKAKAALGDRFELRRFHDIVLINGPMPLTLLEREIDRWIASQR